jgi:hypothetical protein
MLLDRCVKSALSYLLAARRCEIDELERLARTSELVGVTGRFIHALQRERGMSNIYLASGGERFSQERLVQAAACDALRGEVESIYERVAGVRGSARLFNRIAITLESLDGLAELRARIAWCGIGPHEATAAYVRMIGGLLGVVFEAVDAAGDPEVSRALVAMFHFMQGKEYAGQERALGAAVFAAGGIDSSEAVRWRSLIDQQQHCFDVFHEFAAPAAHAVHLASSDSTTLLEIERLRRVGHSPSAAAGAESLVDAWYECCTARLDAMRGVEDALAAQLRALCERKIADAHESLRDEQATLERLHRDANAEPGAPALLGPQLERSVIDLVHEQAHRLQAMHDELDAARTALNERKLIERAKGVLMAHRRIGEDEAYRALRQMAMNQKRRLPDVAQAVLAMAEVLPGR